MNSYLVTFERVGRHGGRDGNPAPAPVTIEAADADTLAWQIQTHVRPYLFSRDVEVVADLETGKGFIFAGMNNGGSFTVKALAAGGESR